MVIWMYYFAIVIFFFILRLVRCIVLIQIKIKRFPKKKVNKFILFYYCPMSTYNGEQKTVMQLDNSPLLTLSIFGILKLEMAFKLNNNNKISLSLLLLLNLF